MHTAYLCPLKWGSMFCMNKLEVQRNCNATDADVMTSEDANSLSNSHYAVSSTSAHIDSLHSSKMRIRSSARASGAGLGTFLAKPCEDPCTYYKHVGFSFDSGRTRSKGSQARKSISFNGSCNAGGPVGGGSASGSRTRSSSSHRCPSVKQTTELGCHSYAICSMLVPLTCNQSNFNKLHHLVEKSANNTQETSANTKTDQSKDQSFCEPPVRQSKEPLANLAASSGVPYWNIYEYENFRELQHGNLHVFDPQTDRNLHRESIILDCYNRLQTSFPRFRKPQLYHVR